MKLSEIGSGALDERFNLELDRVLENLRDPNTDYKGVRKVTITIAFAINETRQMAEMAYAVKGTTVATKTLRVGILLDKDPDTGKPIAKEFGSQIPGQVAMDGVAKQNNIISIEGRK